MTPMKKLKEKLDKAKSKLVLEHPYFGQIASSLKFSSNDNIESFISDGDNFEYNDEYLSNLNEKELEFTLANSAMHYALQGGTLEDGRAYILQLISSSLDMGILMKYGVQLDQVLNDAESHFAKNGSLTVTASPSTKKRVLYSENNTPKNKTKVSKRDIRKEIERAIRTTPGKGVNPSTITTVWIDSYINVLWGGLSVDTYILFKDGTVYEDCEIPPNKLIVSKSKELQPKKWTKSGSGYQIFNKKKGIWKKLDGIRAIKARAGERLNKKYITASGSQMYGSHKSWITFG